TAVLASRPFRASLSSAQDHEHDISNAPLATPVYTVSNFNSLLVNRVLLFISSSADLSFGKRRFAISPRRP
ncbi:hypothetical protein, partial [Burkholderia pseudomallei]|uniref:hypothetical protein n=1 Tax=Burkholderia pseudomallei TaxID=28450 RepID=UPI0021F6E9A5